MFVVRISVGNKSDFKVFEKKSDAERRFWGGWFKVEDYEGASAAIYEIPYSTDVRQAVEDVKNGDRRVLLLNKMPIESNIDLSDLGL